MQVLNNFLNLPITIKQGSTVKATYTYLADGTKIKTINASGVGYDYIGSFKYNRSNSNITLESVATAGGRTYKTSSGYEARYFVTDHLGSTRLMTNSSGTVLEQNDYMPYGDRHANSALAASTNPYLYNGKESQKDFGINYIDSEARFQRLDGAFNSIDPLCEKYYHISPYSYCIGNPINTIDPNGNIWINAQGFLKYQNGKWTKYATELDKSIGQELQSTPTGHRAFKYLVENPIPTQVIYGQLDDQIYGSTKNISITEDGKAKWSVITLDLNQMSEKAKNEGITTQQATASTLGHEIRHTEPENIKMQFNSSKNSTKINYLELDEEKDAFKISNQINYEYKNNIRHVEKNPNTLWNRFMELFRKNR